MTVELAKSQEKDLSLMQRGASLFLDVARFEHAQRVGRMLATSTMVPDQFRGDKGIANCVIALNLSERMQVDPFMLMQNMYIVHGKPGIEAKLAIALVNGCGRFEPMEFEFQGEGDSKKCRAFTKDIKSGKALKGEWVTWKMVKAEGWLDKNGSKWKTMPDLMFTYRSAMFFARVNCPEVLLGLRTKEELNDIIDITPQKTIKIEGEQAEPTDEMYEAKDMPSNDQNNKSTDANGEFIDRFKNLRSKDGVFKFEEENREALQNASEKVKERWTEKYKQQVGGDYYHLQTSTTSQDESSGDNETQGKDREESDISEPSQNGNDYVQCPENGSRKAVAFCGRKCELATKCDPYKEYVFNQR